MIPEFSWYDYGLFVAAIFVTALAFGWAGLAIGYGMKLRETTHLEWPDKRDFGVTIRPDDQATANLERIAEAIGGGRAPPPALRLPNPPQPIIRSS